MSPLLENVGIVVTWALCGVGAVTVFGWMWDGMRIAQTRHDRIKEIEKLEKSA